MKKIRNFIKKMLILMVVVFTAFITFQVLNNNEERNQIPTYQSEFIDSISEYAVMEHKRTDILPSIVIAQAILESSWGSSQLTLDANNLFGVKGEYQGEFVNVETKEYVNDTWITIYAHFKKYPSLHESLMDHTDLLSSKHYKDVKKARNYKQAAKALQKQNYATDPDYAKKLIEIIEIYKLYQYDTK